MSPLAAVMVPAHLARDEDRNQAFAMGRVTKELIDHSGLYDLPHMVGRHGTMWRVLRDKSFAAHEASAAGWVRVKHLGNGVGHRPGQTSEARDTMVRRYLIELEVAGLAERRRGWARATLPRLSPLVDAPFNDQKCRETKAPNTVGSAKFTVVSANRLSPPYAKASGQAVRERSQKQKARDAQLPRNSRGRFTKAPEQAVVAQQFCQKPALTVCEAGRPQDKPPAPHRPTAPDTSKLGLVLTRDGERPLTSSHCVTGTVVRWADAEAKTTAEDLVALNAEFGTFLTLSVLPNPLPTYGDVFCAAFKSSDFSHPDIPLTERILAVLCGFGSKQLKFKDTDDPPQPSQATTQHTPGQRTDS